MPDTKPHLSFDENGVCQACRAHQLKNDYLGGIDWNARENELNALLDQAKSAEGPTYDVLVPVFNSSATIPFTFKSGVVGPLHAEEFAIALRDETAVIFDSTELPLEPPPLDAFQIVSGDGTNWGMNWFTDTRIFEGSVGGEITSLELVTSVPEPTTLLLLGLGLAGLGFARQRLH